MILKSVAVHYHKHANNNFHNKKTMWRFLNDVAAHGYHLTTLSEQDGVFEAWRQQFVASDIASPHINFDLFTTGVSGAVYDEMEMFVTAKSHMLWITGFPIARTGPLSSFKLGIAFDATTSFITITPMTIAFTAKQAENDQIFGHWLDLFQIMYNTWHPIYGHSFSPEADWPEPVDADIQAYHIPHLYEINFLGDELVEKLERKRVLSTPSWKVQPLEDGGVLIVPEFIFGPKDPAVEQISTQHLGMVNFFRGKYT